MEREIVLIRHGEAYSNLSRYNRNIYHQDVLFDARLTHNGIKQCKDVKKRLKINFNQIYVSTLDRALETASIIFKDYNGLISAHELLREYKNCRSSYRKDINYKKNEFPILKKHEIDISNVKKIGVTGGKSSDLDDALDGVKIAIRPHFYQIPYKPVVSGAFLTGYQKHNHHSGIPVPIDL